MSTFIVTIFSIQNRLARLLSLVIFAMFFACINGFSQTVGTFSPNPDRTFYGTPSWPDNYNYFAGSPYVFNDFMAGNMYAEGRLLYSQVPIRINLYNEVIDFLRNDSVFVLGPSSPVDRIVLNGQIFLILDGKFNHVVEGIVKTWSHNFPTVLTKKNVLCLAASYGLYSEVKLQRFEQADKHFVWISEDNLIEVSTTKQLIKALGHQAQLTAFAKKQKISANNPEQLTELLDHYRLLTEVR